MAARSLPRMLTLFVLLSLTFGLFALGACTNKVTMESDEIWQEDPVLGHRLRPNLRQAKVVMSARPHPLPLFPDDLEELAKVTRRTTYYCSTNSRGYRTPEFEDKPAPGIIRVFTMGDSITFGHGVNDDQTYASLLRRKLPADRYEVINVGVHRYDSGRVYDQLRTEIINYGPKVVTICVGINDCTRQPEHVNPRIFSLTLKPERLWQGLDRLRNNLVRMIRLLRPIQAQVILVVPPVGTFFPFPDVEYYCDVIREVARAYKLPLVDLEKAFREAERENGLMFGVEGDEQRVLAYKDGKPTVVFTAKREPDQKNFVSDAVYEFLDKGPYTQRMLISSTHPSVEGHRLIARLLEQAILALPEQPAATK